jgi:hypothetical protein
MPRDNITFDIRYMYIHSAMHILVLLETLIHINGKYAMGKLKSSLKVAFSTDPHCQFLSAVLSIAICSSMYEVDIAISTSVN